MRRVIAVTLVVMGSAGCAAVGARWEKSGASEAERRRDETECAARASRETTVPTSQSVGTSPGTPADPQRARVQPYDSGVFDECMRTRGYERVSGRPPG